MALYDILDSARSPKAKLREAHETSFWMSKEGRALNPLEYRNLVVRIADSSPESLDAMMPLLATLDDGYAQGNEFFTQMNHVGFSILLKEHGYEMPTEYWRAA